MVRSLFTTLLLFLTTVFLQAQTLKIHHINVGQGDCSLIVSPTGKTMLIDAGNNGLGTSNVLPYLQSLGLTKLDYVVTTHYHADHFGGMDEVINGLGGANIGVAIDRGSVHTVPTTAVYTAYATAAATVSGGRQTATVGTVIDLGGGATLKCLATDGSVMNSGAVANATGSENDLSSAWLLSYNEFRYFTGGDCGGETTYYADLETPLSYVVGQVDSFKVNHHGSQYSTNQIFLNAISPTSAVIMVGNGNTYNHPVQAVLDRLKVANCFTYQTELGTGGVLTPGFGAVANGSIVVTTTGHNTYTVSYGTTTDTYTLHTPTSTVAVSIAPAAATISTGGTAQFTATVTGTTATSVTWSCTGGSISAAGLYTAPATAGTYTVKATSTADTTKSASAAVTVTTTTSTTFNEVEPNDTHASANVVGDSFTKILGYFKSTTDNYDHFNVTLLAGHTLTVDMTGPTASGQDYDLYLLSSTGTQLASSTGSSTTEHVSYKNTNVSAAKTITIRVARYNSYSAVTPYTLTLSH